ncbi:hypothetical protein GPECTOR_5g333 [Gonium pectorale]|uniref:SHSP domain-containing protein n=1 Tax=Gonium pectorale TaxID=33097 RepID=A0A150GWU8_GONPE|nr:hypothetical protein GPECTOR_5g333 [Gonium pectorale]|eukprot:KXZ54243.1 hypothetical protein GPECTOR_5g333 [Gonium pectorale]
MALTLFNDPFVMDMDRTMTRMLNSLGAISPAGSRPGASRNHASGSFAMPMDIVETSSAYELTADTPGMSPDDLKVELHEGVITLSGSRKIVRDDKDPAGKVWRSERSSYSFSRSFVLPDNADADAISASMDRGVLKLTVPKKEPQPKPQPKRIAVTGA